MPAVKTNPNSLKVLWRVYHAALEAAREEDSVRPVWTRQFLGYEKSWGELSNQEATILIHNLILIKDPDNFDSRMKLQNLQEMWIKGIEQVLEARPDRESAGIFFEGYIKKMSVDKYGTELWRDLPLGQLRQLHWQAHNRARAKNPLNYATFMKGRRS